MVLQFLQLRISFHPETRLFSYPSMGKDVGGRDYGPEFQDFLFLSPSPRLSPAGGEGVSGRKLT
jgi:hypothetical protein